MPFGKDEKPMAPHAANADSGLKIAVDIVMARLRSAEDGDLGEVKAAAPEIYQLAAALMPNGQRSPAPRTLGELQNSGQNKENEARVTPAANTLGSTMYGAQVQRASYGGKPKPPSLPQARSLMHAVHIGSYRTAERAFAGYDQLTAKAPQLLNQLSPRVERVDLGPQKGIYERLKAGPFASKAEAQSVCTALGAQGVYCTLADFTGKPPG